jgi:hypothetical protein
VERKTISQKMKDVFFYDITAITERRQSPLFTWCSGSTNPGGKGKPNPFSKKKTVFFDIWHQSFRRNANAGTKISEHRRASISPKTKTQQR